MRGNAGFRVCLACSDVIIRISSVTSHRPLAHCTINISYVSRGRSWSRRLTFRGSHMRFSSVFIVPSHCGLTARHDGRTIRYVARSDYVGTAMLIAMATTLEQGRFDDSTSVPEPLIAPVVRIGPAHSGNPTNGTPGRGLAGRISKAWPLPARRCAVFRAIDWRSKGIRSIKMAEWHFPRFGIGSTGIGTHRDMAARGTADARSNARRWITL
jgi:hypothetical protein